MAGGKYDKLAGKTRPGTYINFESERNDVVGNSERGIVLLPLIGYDFGPAKTPITLTAAAPDAYSVELGRSVYDTTEKHMLLIREAFKRPPRSSSTLRRMARPQLARQNSLLQRPNMVVLAVTIFMFRSSKTLPEALMLPYIWTQMRPLYTRVLRLSRNFRRLPTMTSWLLSPALVS